MRSLYVSQGIPPRPASTPLDVREPGLTTCVAHTSMALRKYLHPVAVTSSSSELPDADLESSDHDQDADHSLTSNVSEFEGMVLRYPGNGAPTCT